MLYSVTEAMGTGNPIEVPTPPYISREHITVYVDFIPTTAFEWIGPQLIRVLVPLNKLVRVIRKTSPATRLTVFRDGTGLGGDTLNVDSLQAFYLAQEAMDLAALSGSVVGHPAAGTESTTSGLLGLLTGSLSTDQFTPSLAALVGKIDAGEAVAGSVAWRVAQEQVARVSAIQAEQAARVSAIQAEALARAAAITQEATTRQSAIDSLASQVTTLTSSVSGAVSAIQTEVTARTDADTALSTQLTTLTARMGAAESSISTEARARSDGDTALADQITTVTSNLGTLAGRVTTVEQTSASSSAANANYTIKVEARSDGKLAVAGIKLNATAATAAPTQSDMIFMADSFYFVPSMAGINGSPQTLLTTGLVNGTATTVFNSTLWGDKTVPSRVVVDGFLEARHFTSEVVKASYIDTRGLTIKDSLGNVVLSAGSAIDWAKLGGAASNLSGLGYAGDLNATRNAITYSNTAPASPGDGDIWIDTSVNPNVTRTRNAGAWQVAANLTTDTNQLTDSAGLGSTAVWSNVTGASKPLDNAGRVIDTRLANDPPSAYPVGNTREFKQCALIDLSTSAMYCTLETIKGWVDSSGGDATQWAYVGSGEVWKRSAPCGAAAWGSWVRDLDRNTYTGDLNATNGAPVGTQVGGRDVSVLLSDVDTAKSTASAAAAGLADKLNRAGDIIQGRITMNITDGLFAGTDLNNGVYLGKDGLLAKKAGATTFGIDTAGNATFAGALNAATGTFAGSLSAATGTFSGSLSGASGTFSGSLTASAVNAVNTLNIAGYAVTVPLSAEYSHAANSEAAQVGSGWVTGTVSADFGADGQNAGSVVITTTGTVYCLVAGYAATVTVKVFRDGSPIRSVQIGNIGGKQGDIGTYAFCCIDNPGAGTHSYQLGFDVSIGVKVNHRIISAAITATAVKR